MTNISIAPELYKQVEQLAEERHLTADEILAEAVQHYFRQLQREKIAVESRIYRERHAELKGRYLGKYIAMRDGQVIDTDGMDSALRSYGSTQRYRGDLPSFKMQHANFIHVGAHFK